MHVYILEADANNYAGLLTVDDYDIDKLEPFDGSPMADGWTPVRMYWETEGSRPIPDFDEVSGGLAFDERAVEALGDLLEGELLPIEVEEEGGGPHWLFNCTRLSNALDEERSEVERFEARGRILHVSRYDFDPRELAGETIFKLAQKPRAHHHATDTVRDRVEEAGLRGFPFRAEDLVGRAGRQMKLDAEASGEGGGLEPPSAARSRPSAAHR
jgi:hypothetical protein